jgi:hypothetical protein
MEMDDLTRYAELNKHIASLETFFDVLRVIANHGLLSELKSVSMAYMFAEMAGNLEALKKLHEGTCKNPKEEKGLSHYVSPF